MRNKFKIIGIILLVIAIIFNVCETIYFGMNMEAMSRGEEISDVISQLLYSGGITSLVIAVFIKVIDDKSNTSE